MEEGGDARVLAQRCNMCWNEANGACFRTTCGHLFCESCAFQHFGQSQACAACGASLQEADISELNLGLASSHYEKIVFQEIFKEPDYLSMGRSLARTAVLLHDSMSFVMGQMVLDGQRMADCDATRTAEMAKMKSDIGRMTMKARNQTAEAEQKLGEVEHKLRLREKELIDIQEAYKEKDRKCSAWEKAYNHLRAQLDRVDRANGGRAGMRGGEFTPPESPRAGAMRAGSPSSFARMVSTGQTASVQQQQQLPSPRRSAGSGHSAGRGGTMPRPVDRSRALSPHTSSRAGAYAGYGGRDGGGGDGSRSAWPMARPTTSRGGGGGGGSSSGDRHVSPMLRPRQQQGQGFQSTHSVTPSPTFSAQHGHGGDHLPAKRPETPVELRGYYASSGRSSGTGGSSGGGGGGGGGDGGGARSGSFFPSNGKAGLF